MRKFTGLTCLLRVIDGSAPRFSDIFVDQNSPPLRIATPLEIEVEETRRRYLEASREFLQVTRDIPSGMPHPDGVQRVQRASYQARQAFDVYQRALKKLIGQEDIARSGE